MKLGKIVNSEEKNSLHLQLLFGGNLFDLKADPMALIKGTSTTEGVLHVALTKEKDSVIFYLSMKNLLADRTDQRALDKIIEEEMDHIAFLNREIVTLHHQLM